MLIICLLGATFTTPVDNRVTLWLQQQFSVVNLHSKYFSYFLMQHQPYLYKTTEWKFQMKEWSWSVDKALWAAFSRPPGNEKPCLINEYHGLRKAEALVLRAVVVQGIQIKDPSKHPGLLRAASVDGMGWFSQWPGRWRWRESPSTAAHTHTCPGGAGEC